MFIKTNIPKTTLCLTGYSVDFGDETFDNSILNDQTTEKQEITIFGNRCGHNPYSPRFYNRPDNHQRRPSLLEQTIEKLKDIYHWPKRLLKQINQLHPNNRKKRSERREAIISVAQVLLHYLELETLHVGFYTQEGEFISLDLAYIAKKAGVSFIRAKRAVTDLVKSGYIKLSRQFNKKADGTFAGKASIREINVTFFIDLGMDMQRLFFIREWKRKKQEKVLHKQASKKLKEIIKSVTSLGGQVIKSVRTHANVQNSNKGFIAQALELHKLNPTRSPSDYLKELQRKQE
jgi:hypothetical protein